MSMKGIVKYRYIATNCLLVIFYLHYNVPIFYERSLVPVHN